MDGVDDDQEGSCPLTEKHLAVFWWLYRSRGPRGTPKKTLTEAQRAFGYKSWHEFSALVDEITDAGYWHKDDYGHIEFTEGDLPPQPDGLEPTACLGVPASVRTGVRNYQASSFQAGLANGNHFVVPSKSPEDLSSRRLIRMTRGIEYRLADDLSYAIRKVYKGFAPDPINDKALRASFRRWMTKDGISPDTIGAMIKVFVAEPQFMRKGTPAWKSFLASRQILLGLVEDRKERQRISSYWKRGEK